jgi:hypothetical protein
VVIDEVGYVYQAIGTEDGSVNGGEAIAPPLRVHGDAANLVSASLVSDGV